MVRTKLSFNSMAEIIQFLVLIFHNWSFSNANIPVGMMTEDRCLAVLQGIAGVLMGAVTIAFWDTGLVLTMLTARLKKFGIILGGCVSIGIAPCERSKATSNRARPSN